MTTKDFLDQLRSRDIRVWVDRNQLRCSAPTGRLTPELASELSSRKDEILEFFCEIDSLLERGRPPLRRVSREGDLPLSFAQRRMWFLDRLKPGNPAYNLGGSRYIDSAVDRSMLERAINAVVSRHEILRTVFPDCAGAPVQVILPEARVHLPELDLTEVPDGELWREVARLKAAEAAQTFNLAKDCLLRTKLLKLRTNENILLFTTHHIVADGWSLGIFLADLNREYQNLLAGGSSQAPDLPVQYVDYAVWQNNWISGEVLDALLGYWLPKLRGAEPVLALPTDRPRQSVQACNGAALPFSFSPSLSGQLRALSRREEVTLFMTTLAIFKILLYRYTGQQDILVGTPLANRPVPELEQLIGLFVSTLVLRTDLSGAPSARQLIRRVREVVLEAQAHQDLPFEKLVEVLRPERSMAHTPIFQVAFVFQNTPLSSEFEVTTAAVMFDLNLYLWDVPSGIRGVFEYNTDLFDAERISRMRDHFQVLTEAIVADIDQSISDLPLMTDTERKTILFDWNTTQTAYPDDRCVHQLFDEQARRSPQATAVETIDASDEPLGIAKLTYEELNSRANQLARRLCELGVKVGTPIGVYLDRSIGAIVAFLAVLKSGGAYIPLDRSNPAERNARALHDADIRILLSSRAFAREIPRAAVEVIFLDDTADSTAGERFDPLPHEAGPNDLAYIMFTSGSTGKPNGVCVTHRNIVRLVRNTNYIRLAEDDVILQFAPLSFDASTFEIWGALLNGSRLLVHSRPARSASDLASVLRGRGVTTMWLTSGFFHQMVENELESLCSVRQVLAGGDVVSLPHVQKLLAAKSTGRVLNGYGPTENTTFTCCFEMSPGMRLEGTVPIGKPISNTSVYVLDEHLQPVPVGIIGELFTGGDGVARGYLGAPQLTKARFLPDPFRPREGARIYRTGDLVRYLRDGNIEFIGRRDGQVKIRGFRVEVEEIETLLIRHRSVSNAVVTARDDVSGNKSLIGYFVPKEHANLGALDLRRFVAEHLPDYMVPSAFVKMSAFPLTPNGKVDRKALPAPESATPEAGPVEHFEPRNALETQLLMIWEQVLGRDAISVHDNFFDLGGHSLLAIKLFAQMEKILGRKLPPSLLFQAPTIEQLAIALSNEGFNPQWVSLVAVHPSGSNPPLFAVPGIGGNVVGYSKLARLLGPEQPFYALQSRGLDGNEKPFDTIEKIAEHFLVQIQSVDPVGPYYLAGACMGGAVAYEMAQRLREQRKAVALLALLETWPPEQRDIVTLVAGRFYDHGSFLMKAVLRHFAQIRNLPLYKWPSYLFDKKKIVKEMITTRDIYRGDGYAIYRDRVSAANRRAMSRYVSKSYDGYVTLFLASDRRITAKQDPRLEWGDRASDGYSVFRIPARDSGLLLNSPHVELLAEQLKTCIEQARRAPQTKECRR